MLSAVPRWRHPQVSRRTSYFGVLINLSRAHCEKVSHLPIEIRSVLGVKNGCQIVRGVRVDRKPSLKEYGTWKASRLYNSDRWETCIVWSQLKSILRRSMRWRGTELLAANTSWSWFKSTTENVTIRGNSSMKWRLHDIKNDSSCSPGQQWVGYDHDVCAGTFVLLDLLRLISLHFSTCVRCKSANEPSLLQLVLNIHSMSV